MCTTNLLHLYHTELAKNFQYCVNNAHNASLAHDSQLQNGTPLQLNYGAFGANTL